MKAKLAGGIAIKPVRRPQTSKPVVEKASARQARKTEPESKRPVPRPKTANTRAASQSQGKTFSP